MRHIKNVIESMVAEWPKEKQESFWKALQAKEDSIKAKVIITSQFGSIFKYPEEMGFIKSLLNIEEFDFKYDNSSRTVPEDHLKQSISSGKIERMQYIDGELEHICGFDWLYNVHHHPPVLRHVGDYVDGLLFFVEDSTLPKGKDDRFDGEYLDSVPLPKGQHQIFDVVSGRKLHMINIVYQLAVIYKNEWSTKHTYYARIVDSLYYHEDRFEKH